MTFGQFLYALVSSIAAIIILITAVARLNDIKKAQSSKRWWLRRLGLAMIIAAMMMVVSSYFVVGTPYWVPIQRLLGLWGFALTWITTPGMPPWWRYISRNDPES